MPSSVPSELPFGELMTLRENVLAWISRDAGLGEFLIPDELSSTWTKEQKETWTAAVVEKYMHLDDSEGSVNMRKRIMASETASALRRCCVLLREGTASHRDVMKTAVVLEALWDSISPTMGDDAMWVKCSLTFDTALISIRLAYLWIYLNAEANGRSTTFETRKAVYKECVESFFVIGGPADSGKDKHSGNFKELVETWREELKSYGENEEKEFEMRLKQVEEGYSREATVTRIEKFMSLADMNGSWMLHVQQMDKEMEAGMWRKGARRERKAKAKGVKAREDDAVNGLEDMMSVSSFEAASVDRDFLIESEESGSGNDKEMSSNGDWEAEAEAEADVVEEGRGRRVGQRVRQRKSARLSKADRNILGTKRKAAVRAQRRMKKKREEIKKQEKAAEEEEEEQEEEEHMVTPRRSKRGRLTTEREEDELQSPYVERRAGRFSERRRRVAGALRALRPRRAREDGEGE